MGGPAWKSDAPDYAARFKAGQQTVDRRRIALAAQFVTMKQLLDTNRRALVDETPKYCSQTLGTAQARAPAFYKQLLHPIL
jgi:hypothetical protein